MKKHLRRAWRRVEEICENGDNNTCDDSDDKPYQGKKLMRYSVEKIQEAFHFFNLKGEIGVKSDGGVDMLVKLSKRVRYDRANSYPGCYNNTNN